LDTLKEIAAAINNDPKFSTTINNALSGKQPLDETLTHLSGKDVAGLLAYLGLVNNGAVGRLIGMQIIKTSGTYT
ncbi:phage tail protein, partial [Escherichia coli]